MNINTLTLNIQERENSKCNLYPKDFDALRQVILKYKLIDVSLHVPIKTEMCYNCVRLCVCRGERT